MEDLFIYSETQIEPEELSPLRTYFDIEQSSQNCVEGLLYRDNELYYRSKERGDIQFNLNELWASHQNKKYSINREPLAKSLGIKGQGMTHVWDLTCGSAKDSILILKFGARVTAFERNPSVAALLLSAREKFNSNSFQINFGSALDYAELLKNDPPDVLYYDPMYPEEGKKKSALPRKEMQVFRELVGNDLDEEEVFKWAKGSGVKRLVVKRGVKSPTLTARPSSKYIGKSARYDLYIF
ncbi:class I SAM-dependent methyltransferase [Halobacteriovorax sp. HLS]|uniref:class I SAM-dependent methyltransferase n=1 Tax=Halobacteriovorax sp. HLS TaxID=2234000 RepID=UPI000FD6F8AF|nr:class I SAM-dependent methyltransferase [Halobacteriovorax sp. HLS]